MAVFTNLLGSEIPENFRTSIFSQGIPGIFGSTGFVVENKSHFGFAVAVNMNSTGMGSLQTLAQADVGCDFRIRALNGPGCDKLRSMGFCEEMEVRKLADGRNMICSLCGSRLALSSRLADQVLVSPVGA